MLLRPAGRVTPPNERAGGRAEALVEREDEADALDAVWANVEQDGIGDVDVRVGQCAARPPEQNADDGDPREPASRGPRADHDTQDSSLLPTRWQNNAMVLVTATLSLAKTSAGGPVVDLSALIRGQSHLMITLLLHPIRLLPVLCGSHRQLALENLALRQQLAVYKKTLRRPKLHPRDRLFWICLSRMWAEWRQALIIVTPDTVRWHRRRFRDYWAKLSRRPQVGRPSMNAEIIALVRKMAAANPLWGAPRIHGELLKRGIEVAERTVSRLIPTRPTPPSQTWRTFLTNHVRDPFAERLIGSIRRECLNHVLVLSERHLRNILTGYFKYYHRTRTHLSLSKDAPDGRQIERPELGKVVPIPEVGGLHHR
jgi:hypothetical protein